jgi:hypothetical protein
MQFHSIKAPLAPLREASTWAGVSAAITAGAAMPHPYHIPVMMAGIMAVIMKEPGTDHQLPGLSKQDTDQ